MRKDNHGKNIISVAYSSDQNYLFYTCVSITSLAENADKETFYQIYILVGKDFVDTADILGKLEIRYSNIQIVKTLVDSSLFSNVFINNKHISKAAFYRLALSDNLNIDKCIYLDSDTIVLEDLSPLFHCNIESYYLAGCRDIWIDTLSPMERETRRRQIHIPDMDEYINSGVLVFNLKKIREDKIGDVFLEHLKYNYPYEDQDILNVCCYHHILSLPTKWNRFTAAIGRDEELRTAGVPEYMIKEFKNSDGILHFITDEARPWEGFFSWENWVWWQFAQLWSKEEAYQKIYQYVKAKERQNNWKECLTKYSTYHRIVIWGFTELAMKMCKWLSNAIPGIQLIFCDSDKMKQGQRYEGIEVKSPEEIFLNKDGCLFVIVSQRWSEEIKDILLKEGILADNIQIYKKGLSFYRMLDCRYYDQELDEIFLKEGIEVMDGQKMKELLRHKDWIEKYSLKRWILKEEP